MSISVCEKRVGTVAQHRRYCSRARMASTLVEVRASALRGRAISGFEAGFSRPRARVPYAPIAEHSRTLRCLAWADSPHRGEPCGRWTGCELRSGGAISYGRQTMILCEVETASIPGACGRSCTMRHVRPSIASYGDKNCRWRKPDVADRAVETEARIGPAICSH